MMDKIVMFFESFLFLLEQEEKWRQQWEDVGCLVFKVLIDVVYSGGGQVLYIWRFLFGFYNVSYWLFELNWLRVLDIEL